MKKMGNNISVIAIILTLCSCSGSQQSVAPPQTSETTTKSYTTAFPYRDASKVLNKAKNSILRIFSVSSYNSYSFDKPFITLSDINTNDIEDIASASASVEQSTAGTAIILKHNSNNTLLITCEHVVSFPDTAITYYQDIANSPDQRFVKSISVKQRQSNFIFVSNQLQTFEVIASDPKSDLALLASTFDNEVDFNHHPISFEMGNSDLLEFGSFMYIMGFPKGYLSITRGLAGDMGVQNDRTFVTDALFNPGISGGLVLGSRNNFKSLEWVGMAKSASISSEDMLVPRPGQEKYGNVMAPYQDTVFVQKRNRISYGITQAIPINKIKEFLDEYQRLIKRKGFRYSNN